MPKERKDDLGLARVPGLETFAGLIFLNQRLDQRPTCCRGSNRFSSSSFSLLIFLLIFFFLFSRGFPWRTAKELNMDSFAQLICWSIFNTSKADCWTFSVFFFLIGWVLKV